MTLYAKVPTTFTELVAPFPADIQSIASALREVIVNLLPDADEIVYGGLRMANVLYSRGDSTNVVCGLQPTASHCKLYLHHVMPGDVPDLRIEGSGRNVRHVKVTSVDQARSTGVMAALELARAGGARS
jgi:hypothetical protein